VFREEYKILARDACEMHVYSAVYAIARCPSIRLSANSLILIKMA